MENSLLIFWSGSLVIIVVIIILIIFVVFNQNKVLRLELSVKKMEVEREREARAILREGEDKERRRISAELHDGLGARLVYLKMQLESGVVANNNLISDLDLAIEELREISHNLNPAYLNRVGLFKAIESFVSVLNKHGKIRYHYIASNFPTLNLGKEATVNIMRIVTELLNNVQKHSMGKNAYIQFGSNSDLLYLTVEDDGMGIGNAKPSGSDLPGIGLHTIQERINNLEGKLSITSDHGTLITIELPLTKLEI